MRAADMGSAAAGGELISEVPRKPKLKFLVELFARSPRRAGSAGSRLLKFSAG